MVTHASVPQGYTHVTANTGLARAALPREGWGRKVGKWHGGSGSGGGCRIADGGACCMALVRELSGPAHPPRL